MLMKKLKKFCTAWIKFSGRYVASYHFLRFLSDRSIINTHNDRDKFSVY